MPSMTKKFSTLLHDANDFVITFREVIELSVSHIYLSALPSVHKSSKIAEIFGCKYPSTMKVTVKDIEEHLKILLELTYHVFIQLVFHLMEPVLYQALWIIQSESGMPGQVRRS